MANGPSPNDLTRQQLDELDALLQRMLALPQHTPDAPPAPAAKASPPAAPTPEAPAGGWRADRPPAVPPPRTPHLTAPPSETDDPADVLQAISGVARSGPVSFAPTPVPADPVSPGMYGPPVPVAFAPEPAVPPTPAVPFAPPEPAPPARLFGPPTPDTGVPPTGYESVPLVTTGPAAPDFGPIDVPAAPQTVPAPVAPAAADAVPSEPAPGGIPVLLWPLFAVNWVIETVLSLFGPPGLALTSPGVKHLLGWLGVILTIAAGVWTARGMGWIQFPARLPW